jgi:hypothetical protein
MKLADEETHISGSLMLIIGHVKLEVIIKKEALEV